MDGNIRVPSRKRRHSKACTRCRKRKIRCDGRYPTCGACLTADATCLGFDSIHGNVEPRSTISHLESEVARLELEMMRVTTETRDMSEITDGAVERLTGRLAMAIVAPSSRSRKQENLLPLTSVYFLSGSPVPYISSQAWNNARSDQTDEQQQRAIHISSIPRHVIDIMLKNYCEIYRPQYPAVEESDLNEACEKVYKNEEPSDFDIFCVHITLAISTNTLMRHDEKRASTAMRGFWATAVAHLDQVGLTSSWERLQALQLLAHYGFQNPQDVDCSKCVTAATRLCLQLGLHHELPTAAQIKLDSTTLNTRRRLFWNSYSIDSAFHTISSRPFMWPTSGSTAKFPDFDSPSSPTIHVWAMRQMESEITRGLYFPSTLKESSSDASFDQWSAGMHERLNKWHQMIRQSVSLTEKIEFHELMYHAQILRLNRPSPRCLNPKKEIYKKALKASIALIKEFSIIKQLRKLFNLWHAAHCIIDAGIFLLASILIGIESTEQGHAQLWGEDVTILVRYAKGFPRLLVAISRRWPNIAQHASAIEALSLSVSERLEQWSTGEIAQTSDVHDLKEKLDQFSLVFPLPSEAPSIPDETISQVSSNTSPDEFLRSTYANTQTQLGMDFCQEPIENELQPAFAGTAASTKSYPTFGPSGFQVSTTEPTSYNSGWVETQPTIQEDSLMFQDPYSIDAGDALGWNLAGMDSEQIFAALLEGGEPPLLNDFLTR